MAVGFKFYLILARMHDIDPHLSERKCAFIDIQFNSTFIEQIGISLPLMQHSFTLFMNRAASVLYLCLGNYKR